MSEHIRTDCCIVGAGPAGVVLSYLLAQQGIDVVLVESHSDFDRDFRGDTLHGGILELLDDLGLAQDLLELPHHKMESLSFTMKGRSQTMIDFSLLNVRFPFVTMMPQCQFLEYLVGRTKEFDNFQLRLSTRAVELVKTASRWHLGCKSSMDSIQVDAKLIVACDGRHSKVKQLLNLKSIQSNVAMDVIWFRIRREESDDITAGGYVGKGHLLFVLERETEWQVGYVFTHGAFGQVKHEGLEQLKGRMCETLPSLTDKLDHLQKWNDLAVLNVESSRLEKWYDKNVLLIGDAAHVMSPIGGVGINYAIQDAIVAAGIISAPLLANELNESHLKAVQRKRTMPTRLVQFFQLQMQKRIVVAALQDSDEIRLPFLIRLKFFRKLLAKFISHGLFKVRVPEANRMNAIQDR